MATKIKYKGFYLTACFSKTRGYWVGSLRAIRSYKAPRDCYPLMGLDLYPRTIYNSTEKAVVVAMKEEVNYYIEDGREFLDRQLELTKRMQKYILNTVSCLAEDEQDV